MRWYVMGLSSITQHLDDTTIADPSHMGLFGIASGQQGYFTARATAQVRVVNAP
jgi:hypothetical protein